MGTSYYPAFLNIKEKKCVIIGGGRIAERKVLSLLRCGAKIQLISPVITYRLDKEKQKGNIQHISRNYTSGDLDNAFLVIAATSDEETNRRVASEAPCLVNVVDVPEMANFIVPSVIKKGLMTIAVSTSGASPAMARSVRKELAAFYGVELSKYLVFLKKLRKKALRDIADKNLRQQFLKAIASQEILKIIRERGYKEARGIALKRLSETISS